MVYADLHPERAGRIRITAPFRHTPLVQTLPGINRDKDAWTLPLSWSSALAMRNTFDASDLDVSDELRDWTRADYAHRIAPALALRDVVDLESADLSRVTDPDALALVQAARTLEQPFKRERYPHQTAGAAFLAVARRALLGDEQGSGKTVTVISALRLLHDSGTPVFPLLITGPNTTKIGWQREFDRTWPGHTVAVLKGVNADAKRKVLEQDADVYVLNWESLRLYSRLQAYGGTALRKCLEHGGKDPKVTVAKCDVHPGPLNGIDFRAVIADEAHRIKDPSARVTRALKYASGDAQIRFALTGTPIANAPDDLWSVINWLAPAEWPGRQAFVNRFCDTSFDGFGRDKVIGINALRSREFFSSFDPRFRRMPKKLVLPKLPPVVHERRDVEMAPKQAKAYEQMRERMVAELDGDLVVVTSPLVKMTRLLQFAAAYAEVVPPEADEAPGEEDPAIALRLAAPSCKIDAFMDDLDDFEGQSVVVFAVSRQLIELLSARMEREKIPHGLITGAQNEDTRQRAIDDLQAGKTQFVLCTTGAGGTGITLTAASTAVFLQRPWSMIENEQAESRVHRIGSEQHQQVNIVDYVSEGTVEEVVLEAVAAKGDRLQEILRDRELLVRLLSAAPREKTRVVRKHVRAPDEPGTIPELTV